MAERIEQTPELAASLAEIDGLELEKRLNRLASIGEDGKVGEGGSRLAYRPVERKSREFIRSFFLQAGFDEIQKHARGPV